MPSRAASRIRRVILRFGAAEPLLAALDHPMLAEGATVLTSTADFGEWLAAPRSDCLLLAAGGIGPQALRRLRADEHACLGALLWLPEGEAAQARLLPYPSLVLAHAHAWGGPRVADTAALAAALGSRLVLLPENGTAGQVLADAWGGLLAQAEAGMAGEL